MCVCVPPGSVHLVLIKCINQYLPKKKLKNASLRACRDRSTGRIFLRKYFYVWKKGNIDFGPGTNLLYACQSLDSDWRMKMTKIWLTPLGKLQ